MQAEKQIILIWKCGMILSRLTIFIGICCWIGAGKEILESVYNAEVGWLVLMIWEEERVSWMQPEQ